MRYFAKTAQLVKRYGPLTFLELLIIFINVESRSLIDPVYLLLTQVAFLVYIFWVQDLKFGLFIASLAVLIFLFFDLFSLAIVVVVFGFFLSILHKVYAKTLAKTKQKEERYRKLAEKSLQPIVLKDKEGKIIFASKSIFNVLGINRNLLIGKNMDEYVHEEDKKAYQSFYSEITQKPLKRDAIEIRLQHKNGSWLWIRNDVVNLLRDQYVGAVLASFQDITRQKELDQQRFGSLKREKEARAVAEAAVKARDEFLSIASHELKTPLTTVLLQLQNTLRRILTQSLADFSGEDLVKSLKIAEQQSQRLSILIKDLLNVSLVSTGKLQLEKERVDLSKLVTSLVQRFEAEIKLSGCEVKLDAKKPAITRLDTIRAEQAISNILVNALKYGRGKPIDISVGQDKSWAIVSIKDHGPGIHRKYQDLIFQPFERINNNQAKGLGVGLFIAKQIARAHSGDIKVLSSPDHGAEFLIQFPLEVQSKSAGR